MTSKSRAAAAVETGAFYGVFPQRLKDLMKEQKKSQSDVAEALGITRQAVSNYSTGISSPDWEKLAKLGDYFGVSVDYLVGRSDVPSVDADMQAAVKVLGLSQKAVENIVKANNAAVLLSPDGETTSVGAFFESDYCLSFFDEWDSVADRAVSLYRDAFEFGDELSETTADMLKYGVYLLMKEAEKAALSVYNPDEIIAAGIAAWEEEEAKEAENSDDGQEAEV